MSSNNSIPKLNYKILSASSSDKNEGSLEELKKPLSKGKGWFSERYCTYPQRIFIAFETPINLRQINLLSHEKKISEKISFYSYCPQGDTSIKDYKNIPYLNFGYISLNDNSNNNFKAREFKKVYVDVKCLYLRIDLNKNYNNGYNPFKQVGLINIEFFGYKLPGYRNSLLNIEIKNDGFGDAKISKSTEKPRGMNEFIDELCGEKIRNLNNKLSEATKNQNSNECFKIKECITEINNIAKKIYKLQNEKIEAVKNENFDQAMDLKTQIDALQKQLNYISLNSKSAKKSKSSTNNSTNTNVNNNSNNNSTSHSHNSSLISNENNILEEIKEESEKDFDLNNENIKNLEKYNFTSSTDNNNFISNNVSQGRINNNKSRSSLNSEDFYKQYDDVVVPAVKKKFNQNKSMEDIEIENEEIYKVEVYPLEEINKNDLENYELLIPYITEEGLRKLLSKQYVYKEEGFEILNNKLGEIFNGSKLNDIIFVLFKLEANFFETKQGTIIIKNLELIYNTFKYINSKSNKINLAKDILNFAFDRVVREIQKRFNDSSEKVRKKSMEVYIFILYQRVINFDLLINSLISTDINNKDNNYYVKSYCNIICKLDIISDIFDNYNTIMNNKISTEETIPKELIIDYILLYVNDSKNNIKKKSRKLAEEAAELFGTTIFIKKLKVFNSRDLKELSTKIKTLEPVINQILSSKDRNSAKKRGRSNGSSGADSPRGSRSKSKNRKNEKDEKEEKCVLCLKNMDGDTMEDHMKKCQLCYQCKKCKNYIEVKNLTKHRLEECEYKDEFQQCPRCKEAILIQSYDAHVEKNKCNKYKKNCNRCPLCHQDIPLSKNGFYIHIIEEGCPAKKTKTRKVKNNDA